MIPRTAKNYKGTNNSTSNVTSSHETGKLITLTLTGVRNNHYLYSLRKAFCEFLEEETRGHYISAINRFVSKYNAANTLFPEFRENIIGKTVIIK